MKILVTGASGFVGSAFMRRFAGRADLELFGVARRPSAMPNYTQVDLSEPFTLAFRPDAVIHCAARASPWGKDREFQQQNVNATENLIRFCEGAGMPKLVYLSSSSVFYRHEDQFGLNEDSPIGPTFVNAYARTKHAGEQLVRDYAGQSVILRPRAVFGPGDTVLFPRVLRAAEQGKLPIFVRKGAPVIGDLIYIDVLCDYMLAAATQAHVTGAYNVTNNCAVPIEAFLASIFAQLGLPRAKSTVRVSTAMFAATVIESCYRILRLRSEPPITRFGVSVFAYSKTFDVSRCLADMGSPSVSLEEGTARFVAWQRAQ